MARSATPAGRARARRSPDLAKLLPSAARRVRDTVAELAAPLADPSNGRGPERGYRVRRDVRNLRAVRQGGRAWALESVEEVAWALGVPVGDLEETRAFLLDAEPVGDWPAAAEHCLTRAVEVAGGDASWPADPWDDFGVWGETLRDLGATPALVAYLDPPAADE